jgi:hypothetical protein
MDSNIRSPKETYELLNQEQCPDFSMHSFHVHLPTHKFTMYSAVAFKSLIYCIASISFHMLNSKA